MARAPLPDCGPAPARPPLPSPARAGLMQKVKLGPLHNFWSHIFDFTPKDGNWRILPAGAETSTAALLGPLPDEAKEVLGDKPSAVRRRARMHACAQVHI